MQVITDGREEIVLANFTGSFAADQLRYEFPSPIKLNFTSDNIITEKGFLAIYFIGTTVIIMWKMQEILEF